MPPRREILLRRIYDDRGTDSGSYRVLVDRLWPRGVTKSEAALDEWLKEVAPSTELRRWYGHDVRRFREFARRYRAELRGPPASIAVDRLIDIARSKPVTLLTATRDVEHSGALVLEKHMTTVRRHAHRQGGTRAYESSASSRR